MTKESECILPKSWNQVASVSVKTEAAIRVYLFIYFYQKSLRSLTTPEAGEGMETPECSHTVDQSVRQSVCFNLLKAICQIY